MLEVEKVDLTLPCYKDHTNGECVYGGYGYKLDNGDKIVCVDKNDSIEEQIMTLAHELVELHFPHIKHSKIDSFAIDMLKGLQLLKVVRQ